MPIPVLPETNRSISDNRRLVPCSVTRIPVVDETGLPATYVCHGEDRSDRHKPTGIVATQLAALSLQYVPNRGVVMFHCHIIWIIVNDVKILERYLQEWQLHLDRVLHCMGFTGREDRGALRQELRCIRHVDVSQWCLEHVCFRESRTLEPYVMTRGGDDHGRVHRFVQAHETGVAPSRHWTRVYVPGMRNDQPPAYGAGNVGWDTCALDVSLDVAAQFMSLRRVELPGNNGLSYHRSTPLM